MSSLLTVTKHVFYNPAWMSSLLTVTILVFYNLAWMSSLLTVTIQVFYNPAWMSSFLTVTTTPTPPDIECPYGGYETDIEQSAEDFEIEIPGYDKNAEDVISGSGRSVILQQGQVILLSLNIPNVPVFKLTQLSFKITGAKKVIIRLRIEPPHGPPFTETFRVSTVCKYRENI